MTQELDWQRIGLELSRYLHDARRGRAAFAHSANVRICDLEALFAGQPVHHVVIERISKEAGADYCQFHSHMRSRVPHFEVPESDPPTPLRSGSFLMHSLSIDDPDRIVVHLLLIRHDPVSRRTQFVSARLPSERGSKTDSGVHDGFVWHAVEAGTTQLVSEDKGLLQVVTLARPQVRLVGGDGKALIIKGTAQMIAARGDFGFYPAITPVLLQNYTLPRSATPDLDSIDNVGALRALLEDPEKAVADLLGRIAEDRMENGDMRDALHDLASEVMPVFGALRDLVSKARPHLGALRDRSSAGHAARRSSGDEGAVPSA